MRICRDSLGIQRKMVLRIYVSFCNVTLLFLVPILSLLILDTLKYTPDVVDLGHHLPKLYIICYILQAGNGKNLTGHLWLEKDTVS